MAGNLPDIERYGLVQKVLDLAKAGKSSREIARVLAAEDGLEVTHNTVARYLKGMREERAEQTRQIVQDHIQKSVPRDLEILEEVRDQLDAWRKDESFKVGERLSVIRELRSTIETRLKYAGAEEPPKPEGLTPDDLRNADLGELAKRISETLA